MFDNRNIVSLGRAGRPNRERPVWRLDLFGNRKIENFCEEASDAFDIGAVKQEMIEPAGTHAPRVLGRHVGVAGRRRMRRQFHIGTQLDAMAARDCEAKAATRAGEIIHGDLLNRNPPISHALSEDWPSQRATSAYI